MKMSEEKFSEMYQELKNAGLIAEISDNEDTAEGIFPRRVVISYEKQKRILQILSNYGIEEVKETINYKEKRIFIKFKV